MVRSGDKGCHRVSRCSWRSPPHNRGTSQLISNVRRTRGGPSEQCRGFCGVGAAERKYRCLRKTSGARSQQRLLGVKSAHLAATLRWSMRQRCSGRRDSQKPWRCTTGLPTLARLTSMPPFITESRCMVLSAAGAASPFGRRVPVSAPHVEDRQRRSKPSKQAPANKAADGRRAGHENRAARC